VGEVFPRYEGAYLGGIFRVTAEIVQLLYAFGWNTAAANRFLPDRIGNVQHAE
jgi:hypothetical protein